MVLQTRPLVLVGLGVSGDSPPAGQPKLEDGVHLRWGFTPERGFPWFGFHLFRRPHQESAASCLSEVLPFMRQGSWPDRVLGTSFGRLSSDADLTFTAGFPPDGRAGIDLAGRRYLRFELRPGDPARRIEARIGFFGEAPRTRLVRILFLDRQPCPYPNPLVEEQVRFEVGDTASLPSLTCRLVLSHLPSGPLPGLDCDLALRIFLPVPASPVELLLSRPSAAPVEIEAFTMTGASAGRVRLQGDAPQPETVRLTGGAVGAIARLVILAPGGPGSAILHALIFTTEQGSGGAAEIRITALHEGVPVAAATVAGRTGETATTILEFDAITEVELSPGPAALLDLCFVPVARDATMGWTPAPSFPSPMRLPVTHPAYPCTPGAAENRAAAEALALSRVRYGKPADWGGEAFGDLYEQLLDLVRGGPSAGSMASRFRSMVPGVPDPPDPGAEPPVMPEQFPLDLVLLAALDPACAQILGLYWIDATAAEGVSHDYLLVANHELASRRNANGILEEIRKTGFSRLDAWISFGRRRALAAPLAPPGDVRVYALPGGTLRTRAGYLRDATNNAGLRWHRGLGPTGVPLPGRPVLYHVRRAALGDGAAPGKAGAYELITRDAPVLATARLEEGEPQRPADWPPFPFEFLDTGLPEGWFGYRVSGVDLFGRHSRPSAPAVWHRWEPAGEQVVHPSAVRLLDQVPPPPPTGVEAWVLDPADPAVVQDTAYLAWRAKRQTVTGLRVRWRWTAAQARQAPDTQEFRLYFHPGSALPAPDPGQAPHWQERIRAVGFDESVQLRVEPALDRAGRLLQGAAATVAGAVVSLDGAPDLSGVRPREVYVFLERDTRRADRQFLVTAVDDDAKTVRVQGRPDLGGTPSAWVLGPLLVREYEIFLPASGDADRAGLPLVPSRAEPVVYAHVGVTAADDRPHAADARTTGRWSGRPGNEGRTAPPVKVFRVLRTPPPAPVPLPAAARVFATPADYHGRSFYTFRWRAEEHLKVHVFRALDDALFQTDWRLRPTRKALAATDPALFPPDWNAARRRDAAAKLNALARLEDYRMLPDDALRVLAGLPGNERAFTQVTLTPLDPADAATTDRPGPDEPPDRPRDPSLCVYIDTLDGRAANRYFYRALYLDGAHNRSVLGLAGPPVWLPEVEPPRAPVITRIAGGDREITLAWASNREPSLKEYRVYRTADPEAVRDVRRMEQIQVKTESRPPDQRPAEVTWKNRRVPGLTSFYYRVVAVDATGNLSEPSESVAGRALDEMRPEPPQWNPTTSGPTLDSIVLSWTSSVQDLSCLVERRLADAAAWEGISGWLSRGLYSHTDSTRISGLTYAYRLRVRDQAGRTNKDFLIQVR